MSLLRSRHFLTNLILFFVIATIGFFWYGIKNMEYDVKYEEREIKFQPYSQSLSKGTNSKVRIQSITKTKTVEERANYDAAVHIESVRMNHTDIELSRTYDRGDLVERTYYWFIDDEGNPGVLAAEGVRREKFEQYIQNGELQNETFYGVINKRGITAGIDSKDISAAGSERVQEALELNKELEDYAIFQVIFGMRQTEMVEVSRTGKINARISLGVVCGVITIVLFFRLLKVSSEEEELLEKLRQKEENTNEDQ